MNLPASAACQLVPQATIFTSRKLRNSCSRDVHLVEKNLAGLLRDSAEQRVADGARLFEDFLLHEMLEAALFGHDRVPGDVLGGAIDRMAFKIDEANALRSKHGDFAIAEEENAAGVLQDRGNVAGDEKFVFAEADDDGRAQPRGDNFVGIFRGDARPGRRRRSLP